MDSENNRVVSFDLHDTMLVFKFGSKFSRIKFFRIIFYFLSNFRFFIFIYTFFCKRNEQLIELMEKLKIEGNKIIILTSTHEKSAKIIDHFLNKSKITYYDEVIFRKNFLQKEGDYKVEEIIQNNIALHYDDSREICSEINNKGKVCILI